MSIRKRSKKGARTEGGPERAAVPRASPEALAERLGDKLLVVHAGTGRFYELNATAARSWELLGEGLAPEGIARRLAEEFEVSEAEAAASLAELVTALRREGLVEDAP